MENQNLSAEQLDNLLGTSQVSFEKFKIISIDNGSDLMGTGATGSFISKKYNEVKKESEKTIFAEKSFEGIIIASKAMLSDKGKSPTWMTGEFDPTNKAYQIEVIQLSEGKFVKNQDGTVKKTVATYSQIKASRSIANPDGTVKNSFDYYIVLYVLVGEEIIKLKMKGTARTNYFNYSKSLNSIRAKLYNVYTLFTSYTEKSTGKYAIQMATKLDKNGVPVAVDPESIRESRLSVAKAIAFTSNVKIEAPKSEGDQGQLAEPNSQVEEEAPMPDEYPEPEDEINIADVPL